MYAYIIMYSRECSEKSIKELNGWGIYGIKKMRAFAALCMYVCVPMYIEYVSNAGTTQVLNLVVHHST